MREAIVDEAYDHFENPESLTFSGVGMGTSGEKACPLIICATTEGMSALEHEAHKRSGNQAAICLTCLETRYYTQNENSMRQRSLFLALGAKEDQKYLLMRIGMRKYAQLIPEKTIPASPTKAQAIIFPSPSLFLAYLRASAKAITPTARASVESAPNRTRRTLSKK